MINEGKDHTFSIKTVQREISKLGYKRRVVDKKVVVRQVNKKNLILWCKARRHWTVGIEWKI